MPRINSRNVTQYWYDPHVRGLSLLRADFTTHEYKPHIHEEWVIAATERGGALIKSRGVVEEAHPGALFVFNPEEPQSAWMGHSRRWLYRALYLNGLAMLDLASALGVATVPRFTRNRLADPELIDRVLTLHRCPEGAADPPNRWEMLIDSFGMLLERHGRAGGRLEPAPKDRALFRRVERMMRERYSDSLLLDDLASVVGLTTFQLIGLFKRVIGLTPHAYLTQLRLRSACRHIRSGMPIAAVAMATGFCDQSALNHRFKQSYGITPKQLAKAARSGRPVTFMT
jgi:AraC-like DNA-binding protein